MNCLVGYDRDQPRGLPIDVFDGIRVASIADRSKLYRDLASGPFFDYNRPAAKSSLHRLPPKGPHGLAATHREHRSLPRLSKDAEDNKGYRDALLPVPVLAIGRRNRSGH